MVPMEEQGACEECTTNCIMMHKKDRNPLPTVTTFVKVMIGDDYNSVLFLPPRFAESVGYIMADQTTTLEDSSGDHQWPVTYKKINGLLGFENGWEKFASDHSLQQGDILVFHFIMETKFVVLMYGKSGCPELRQQMIATKEKNISKAENANPSNVKTNGHHYVHKSCDKKNKNVIEGFSLLDVNESCSESERSQPVLKRSKKKEDCDIIPPNGNTTNGSKHDVSSSRPMTSGAHKQTGQKSEPLIRTANHDAKSSGLNKEMSQRSKLLDSGTPTTVKQFNLVQNNDDDECRTKINKKNESLVADDCSPLDVINTNGHQYVHVSSSESERSQPVIKQSKEKEDGDMVSPNGNTTNPNQDTSFSRPVTHKETGQRSEPLIRNANHDTTSIPKKEINQSSKASLSGTPTTVKQFNLVKNNNENLEHGECRIMGSKRKSDKSSDLRNRLEKELEARKKPRVTPNEGGSSPKQLKIDNVSNTMGKMLKKEPDISSTKLPSVDPLFNVTYSSFKPIATQPKMPKKEPETEINGNSYNNNVKQEPQDFEELPPAGLTNSSFSAVMNSYQYLELPDWVKLSEVILLINNCNRWPVKFETNLGLKALTQNWGCFAKDRGIKLGDKCEFVLESELKTRRYRVFSVHISH